MASVPRTAVSPSAVRQSWTTTALLVPATVSNPKRVPRATLLATISATFGPGMRMSTAVASTKPR
jgi:hypothetical protein